MGASESNFRELRKLVDLDTQNCFGIRFYDGPSSNTGHAMTSTPEPTYDVVWPLGRKAFGEADTVKRVDDLSGKTVAAIWDYLFRGDEIFEIISGKLGAAFPGMKFVNHSVFGNTHGSRQRELVAAIPALLQEHQVDAVISSVGA